MKLAGEFLMWFAIKYPSEYKVKVGNFVAWKKEMEEYINADD